MSLRASVAEDDDGQAVITFEAVSKTYRDGTTAVSELDLVLPSDQVSVLVGPSGCGKTTTLQMINRMIEPTAGSISWDGTPLPQIRRTTLRRQMGYVIQSGGLFPHRTVLDNICTVPTLLGWSRARSRSRALELLSLVGLDRSLAQRFPAQLSGGQQQRVGVARALAADPVLLLMDEPFSAVDPVVRADLQELVKGLQRELGKTIVMITHDIDEAMIMGDQVVIMRVGGRIAQMGTPDEILDRPLDDFVAGFVGRDRGYRALTFAPAAGLPVARIRSVRSAASVATGSSPAVVVDGEGRPLGWADAAHGSTLLPLGATFAAETDTLRAVVDAALSSPVGLAVAVQSSGRLAGVVSAADALEAVRRRRLQVAERHGSAVAAAPDDGDAPSADPATLHEEAGPPADPAAPRQEVGHPPTPSPDRRTTPPPDGAAPAGPADDEREAAS
ncbi:ABC transporter ATP-binding protein [Auraticoccus cholistanensis]|uniref:ABC transporter ATP-binding protein n=1 Tax=Auraticoccus cholistanensis TaxID=2656650 RepID=UPI002F90EDC5